MLQDLNHRFSQKIQQKRLFNKYERDLAVVNAEIKTHTERLDGLRTRLEKETSDVESFEGNSLRAVFHIFLGSREEQLNKERQEMLAAQLKFDQTAYQVKQLEQDRDYLLRELDRLQYQEADYQDLLAEKENFLLSSSLPAAEELIALTEQIAVLTAEEKELTEAISAGKDVFKSLDKALTALRSAEGWGTWDLLGGGILSTAVKHSKIDEARDHIYQVQIKISRFQRELADVGKNIPLRIEIGGFESFADYFFDGLIFDWVVQTKIIDSQNRCQQAEEQLVKLVSLLKTQRENVKSQRTALSEKRTGLIEQT